MCLFKILQLLHCLIYIMPINHMFFADGLVLISESPSPSTLVECFGKLLNWLAVTS